VTRPGAQPNGKCDRRGEGAHRTIGPTVRIPLPPPVSPGRTFFFGAPRTAGTAQNAGFPGLVSEPQALPERPISGRSPSLSGPFLRRNQTTPVLVKLSELRKFNALYEAEPARVSNFARRGGVNPEQTVWLVTVRLSPGPGDLGFRRVCSPRYPRNAKLVADPEQPASTEWEPRDEDKIAAWDGSLSQRLVRRRLQQAGRDLAREPCNRQQS
jgi:hypothetical protein